MKITKDQVEVIKILHFMFWQSIFCIVVIIAFFMVFVRFFAAKDAIDITKYTAMEGFLGATVFVAFKYFFPIPKGEDDKNNKNVSDKENDKKETPHN